MKRVRSGRAIRWATLLLAAWPAAALHDPALAASPGATCPAASPLREAGTYDFAEDSPGTWLGSNSPRSLRIEVSIDGARVGPLDREGAPWDWSLRLERYGPPDEVRPATTPQIVVYGDRAELLRGSVLEWFANDRKGIETGFDLDGAGSPGLIVLEFSLHGTLTPKVREDGREVRFFDARGVPVLRYGDLQAVDAEGRGVDLRIERVEGRDRQGIDLRLLVQGAEHAYPIRVQALIRRIKGDAGAAVAPAGVAVEPAGAASGPVPLVAPSNDQCGGAEAIPGNGPLPYLSGVYDITDATTTGDPALPSCQTNVSRSIWFAFTPAASGYYDFALCADGPTATTVVDTVLAVYSSTGACSGLSELSGGCNDDGCVSGSTQSVVNDLQLSAGTTYYIVAWQFGATPPDPASAAVQLRVAQGTAPPAAPPNDQCGGAEVIPGAGPFPYLSSVVADITDATSVGDPPAPTCQPNVSRSVWYSFTPAVSANYTFSVCADGPTGSTVDDTVMAIYSSTGTCGGLTQVAGGCDDDSCGVEDLQSVIGSMPLSAGSTYYVVVWEFGSAAPTTGNTAVQMRVTMVPGPANDTCAGVVPLGLNAPLSGSTASATDNYELPAASPCFAGIGQSASTATGGDVVYRFTAPKSGVFSFRVGGYDTTKNPVLYLADNCPVGAPPIVMSGCLGAANRNSNGPAEEVACLPLNAGQTVYVFVDEAAATAGSGFALEVDECRAETEANGTPATASSLACGIEGSITPGGDIDFFALGTPAANSRLFALVDGAASNSNDYDLRVTTDVDTLEFDDFDNDTQFGTFSPNVAGTMLTGVASYLRVVQHGSTTQAEPYRLYSATEPASTTAAAESEPNNSIASATSSTKLYFSGTLSSTTDEDFFSFTAQAGDLIQIGLDLDPTRNNTPFNGALSLLDGSGTTLVAVNDGDSISSTTPGTGSLTAINPKSPAEGLVYRARAAGTYYAHVFPSGTSIGDYLLAIALNCRIGPPTDLRSTQTDAPDPVTPGANVTYTVTVSDLGPLAAPLVSLRDELPAGSVFVSATPSQGSCAGTGPVQCALGSLANGASATVQIVVTAPGAPGTITNTATASSALIDSNAANDVSQATTTVGQPDSDGDGVPDATDCAPNDATAWAVPTEATGLVFPTAADLTQMQWSTPATPGGSIVYYDLLRSTVKNDFSAATCVATGVTTTSAADATLPSAAFYYLVRARNACGGTLGADSSGTPRTGRSCP